MDDGQGSGSAPATGAALSEQQIALIKREICKPRKREATEDEISLFRYQCERTGLDPFSRQIYAIFRYDSQTKGEKMSIQVSIDGLRLIAERTGKYLGQDGPFWCGKDGEWSDTWFHQEHPQAAKVVVRKLLGGNIAETPAVAHYDEYVPLIKGKPGGLWPYKPALMNAKCAEALALRKAFPAETSGLYTAEEMSQADVGQIAPKAALETTTASDFDAAPYAPEPTEVANAQVANGITEIDSATAADIEQRRKRTEEIIAGFKALSLNFNEIGLLLGSCGIDGLRANSRQAVKERIASLTEDQATQLEAAIDASAETGAAA